LLAIPVIESSFASALIPAVGGAPLFAAGLFAARGLQYRCPRSQ
jgi:hypothetical protein